MVIVMQDEKELMNSLLESLQLDKESIQASLVMDTIEDVLNLGRKYERKNRKQQSVHLLKRLEELECKKVDTDKVQVTILVKDYEKIRKLFLELVNK